MAQSFEVQEAQNARQDGKIDAKFRELVTRRVTAQQHHRDLHTHRHELNGVDVRSEERPSMNQESVDNAHFYYGQDSRLLVQRNISGQREPGNPSSMKPEGIPAEPPRRVSCPEMFTSIQAAIRPPPKFNDDAYRRWEDHLDFCKEAHAGRQESALISEVALSAIEPLCTLVVKFPRLGKNANIASNI